MILSGALRLPVEERVRRGEAYLDRELPGWDAYIDRELLLMASAQRCLLGQLAAVHPAFADMQGERDYDNAVNHLDPDYNCGHGWSPDRDEWPVEYGFNVAGPENGDEVPHDDLARAWRKVLTRRQAAFAVRPGSTPSTVTATAEQDFVDGMMDNPIYGDD